MRGRERNMNIKDMQAFWGPKEDLYSFLDDETQRLEKLIDLNSAEISPKKYAKILNLFEQYSPTDLWVQKFLTCFPEYGKGSYLFPEPAPNTWPTLANTCPIFKSEYNKNKKIKKSEGFNEDQKQFFKKNGILGPIKIDFFQNMDFSFFEEVITHSGEKSKYFFKSNKIIDLAIHDKLLSKVQDLIGENVVLLDDTIVFINPHQNAEATHTDIQGGTVLFGDDFFRDDPGFLNVWISISGTDCLKAPLHFFPGTHRFSIIPTLTHLYAIHKHPERLPYYSNLFACLGGNEHVRRSLRLHIETLKETFEKDLLKRYVRQEIYTDPGDCIFFNSHVLHGSSPNLSNTPRIAIVFRYRQAEAKPLNFGFPQDILNSCLELPKNYETMDYKTLPEVPVVQVLGNQQHKGYRVIDVEKIRSHIT